jgi:hypothetical protein
MSENIEDVITKSEKLEQFAHRMKKHKPKQNITQRTKIITNISVVLPTYRHTLFIAYNHYFIDLFLT